MYSEQEIGKRQSISTLVFHGYRPVAERALADLAHDGIEQIELLESPDQFDMTDSHSIGWINEACRAQGIRIAAYHCWKTHFNDIDTEVMRVQRVDRCRAQIDTMLEVGAHRYISLMSTCSFCLWGSKCVYWYQFGLKLN